MKYDNFKGCLLNMLDQYDENKRILCLINFDVNLGDCYQPFCLFFNADSNRFRFQISFLPPTKAYCVYWAEGVTTMEGKYQTKYVGMKIPFLKDRYQEQKPVQLF